MQHKHNLGTTHPEPLTIQPAPVQSVSEPSCMTLTHLLHTWLQVLTHPYLPFQDQMTFLEAVEDTSSYAGADEKSEDFYGGGGQFRKGGKEHFPQLWCSNGTYSSYGQVSIVTLIRDNAV